MIGKKQKINEKIFSLALPIHHVLYVWEKITWRWRNYSSRTGCFDLEDDDSCRDIFSSRYKEPANKKTTPHIASRSNLSCTVNKIICLKIWTTREMTITFPNFCLSSSISWIKTWSACNWSLDCIASLFKNISYNHQMMISPITHNKEKSITSIKWERTAKGLFCASGK